MRQFADRLKSVNEKLNGSGSDSFKQAYTFDRWGNRTIDQANTTSNVPHPNFGVNTATNQLTAPAGSLLQYDAAGNQTKDTYTSGNTDGARAFDAENRMVSAMFSGEKETNKAYYTYDGDGRRVRRNTDGVEIWQVYGFGGELLAEYPQTGATALVAQPQKEYGYRNGQLLVTAEPGTNTAWNKSTMQIDNFSLSTTSAKAANGNADGVLAKGSVAATNSNANSWWHVDLASVQSINSITVWGRTDCCPETTSDFYVFVSDVPFTSTNLTTTINQAGVSNYYHAGFSGPSSTSGPTSINVNRTGRYVRVQLAGTGSLALAEVQVWNTAAKIQWQVTDHLGTPRMVVDKPGALANVKRHDYLPFGEEIGGPQVALIGGRTTGQGYSADSVRQHFTGYETDTETGLNFAQARYQSTLQGRFTSADPFGASASVGDPQSFNRYSYVLNQPVTLTDPSGMIPYNGADQSWGDVANGFWGSGYLGGNGWGNDPSPGQTTVNANFQSDVRLVVRFRSLQYSTDADPNDEGGNFTEHVKFWWEKAWERFSFPQNGGSSDFFFGKDVGRDTTIFGTFVGIGERMNIRPGFWRGLNGQWFRIDTKFWGNQHTGSKLDAISRGKAFKFAGKFLFFVGAANTAFQFQQGNISGTKACVDLCFSAAGTFGGPPGMAANVIYSGVDMTVGWPAVGHELQKSFSDPDTQKAIISQWQ